jgi:hypothetical protein
VSTAVPRREFRVLSRTRGGYDGAAMYDVQLQRTATGALVWAQSFSDQSQAEEFQRRLEEDLDHLDGTEFRAKYGVPSTT